jgi:putative Holliday junction resolvase
VSFVETIEALAVAAPTGALIGLDPGTKTIGVAISDERRTLASPLETIHRTKLKADLARLRELVDYRAAKGIVLGMPLHMNGDAGRRAQSVRAFSRSIEDALGLPVLHWDERLSTVAAEEAMIAAEFSRAKRAARIDAHAAAAILQGALDRLAVIRPDA